MIFTAPHTENIDRSVVDQRWMMLRNNLPVAIISHYTYYKYLAIYVNNILCWSRTFILPEKLQNEMNI